METDKDISIDGFSSSTESILSTFETSFSPKYVTEKTLGLRKKNVMEDNSFSTDGCLLNSTRDESSLALITEGIEKLSNEKTSYKNTCLFSENYSTHNMVSSPHENLGKSLENISFNLCRLSPKLKVEELKQLMNEVDEAYMEWKTNEFLLECCKVSTRHMPPDLKEKINDILYSPVMAENTRIKSESGEIFNILGLDDEDFKDPSLSTLEKAHFRGRVIKEVEDNLRKLNEQKKSLQDQFGAHCQKIVSADSLVCKKQEEVQQQHLLVQEILEEGSRLMRSISRKMEDLTRQRQEKDRSLLRAMYDSFNIKKNLLSTKTSVLKIKMDQMAHSDKNFTKAMNSVGDELKTSLHTMREELVGLQQKLYMYETTENSSKKYKEIVSEFAKTTREVQHKYQTLNILNESNNNSF